jgi:hypothetical protein
VHDRQGHDWHGSQFFNIVTSKTFVFLHIFVVLDTLFTLALWFFLRLANIAILALLALQGSLFFYDPGNSDIQTRSIFLVSLAPRLPCVS